MALSSAPPIASRAGALATVAKLRTPRAGDPEGAGPSAWAQAARPPGRGLAALRRRTERTEAELEKAEKVIEVHGNVSALLGRMTGRDGIATG